MKSSHNLKFYLSFIYFKAFEEAERLAIEEYAKKVEERRKAAEEENKLEEEARKQKVTIIIIILLLFKLFPSTFFLDNMES